ncbi:MAG: DNA/RNA non-specific endonuclease [Paramuribaculum sp.]|nr:DNA/RNA non-specific endonuclease [Paramuribaculum sp.]
MAQSRPRNNKSNHPHKSHRIPLWAILLVVGFFVVALTIRESNVSSETYSTEMSGTGSDSRSEAVHHGVQSYGDLMMVVTNPSLTEQRVDYKGFDVSYNSQMHLPNWVSWELLGSETEGDVTRAKKFVADESVAGCAEDYDYSYSGYDRGHMAPAGDMKWDGQAMAESFYMTNICPQDHALNSGAWGNLEKKCRTWARHDSVLYIVSGPVLTDKLTETIGDNRVSVPKRFFKVILAPYAVPPRAIGFVMNNGKVKGGMQEAAVSVDEVERITGHDFFSTLPDSLEQEVERQCDFHYWSTLR